MSELARRVSERMVEVGKQVRADYQEAWDQMSAIEKRDPDAVQKLEELVAVIEAKRKSDRLESFEKLAKIVGDASGEVQRVLADVALRNFERGEERGEDEAFRRMAQSVDRLGFAMFGRSWVEDQISEVIREQYGERKKGNGRKD